MIFLLGDNHSLGSANGQGGEAQPMIAVANNPVGIEGVNCAIEGVAVGLCEIVKLTEGSEGFDGQLFGLGVNFAFPAIASRLRSEVRFLSMYSTICSITLCLLLFGLCFIRLIGA